MFLCLFTDALLLSQRGHVREANLRPVPSRQRYRPGFHLQHDRSAVPPPPLALASNPVLPFYRNFVSAFLQSLKPPPSGFFALFRIAESKNKFVDYLLG